MSRQGAGTSVPAPLACPGGRVAGACGAAGVPGVASSLILAWPLCVPVGGGPPARSPHALLSLGVVDLEARPGPAAAHRHRGQAPQASRRPIGRCLLSVCCRPGPAAAHRHRGQALWHSNFARNSPTTFSNIEFASLELQRFWAVLKSDRGKLCAKFVWRWSCRRLSNFARNSPAACSNLEFVSLELQRFWAVLKSDRGKLCAKFVWRWPR